MPARINYCCLQPGCHRKQATKYCDEHTPNYDDTRPSFYRRGYTRAWEKLRGLKLALEPFCCDCGRIATEAHHIDRIRDGNPVVCGLERLLPLCASCHSKRTNAGE